MNGYASFRANRESQLKNLRTTGWRVVTYKKVPVVIAFKPLKEGKIEVKGWRGKADKPAFYYSFRDESRARVFVENFVSKVTQQITNKVMTRIQRTLVKASDHWAVGDVVYNSWGYDQTNVDFYEVVELKPKSVVLRKVAQNSSDRQGQPGGGYTQPRRGDYIGQPFIKHVTDGEYLSFEHGGGSKWDGRPKYTSSYH